MCQETFWLGLIIGVGLGCLPTMVRLLAYRRGPAAKTSTHDLACLVSVSGGLDGPCDCGKEPRT
jgi:hypothetical protein